jgi:hypothetical protein
VNEMDEKKYGDELFIYAMVLLDEHERREQQIESEDEDKDD